MIHWIKCYLFGKHKFHVHLEKCGKKVDVSLICLRCNFNMGALVKFIQPSKLKPGMKYKHLMIVK